MNEKPTPETDASIIERRHIHKSDGSVQLVELIDAEFARRLERERDEAREQNAYLRCIAERAIDYLDQSYRDGFSDEASELRYELKQLEEAAK